MFDILFFTDAFYIWLLLVLGGKAKFSVWLNNSLLVLPNSEIFFNSKATFLNKILNFVLLTSKNGV